MSGYERQQLNKLKQLKNAKRGGYIPNAAKDKTAQLTRQLNCLRTELLNIEQQKYLEFDRQANERTLGFIDALLMVRDMLDDAVKTK